MHSALKKALLEQFRAVESTKKEALYRQVRQVVVQLVKIAKLTTLYPIEDPVYDDLVETMKTNLDAIGNSLPVCAINIKKVGFYYMEKRLKIFDEGEKDLRNLFVTNEIRELAFIKGISIEEIRNFFAIIGKTISYTGAEHDINTLLWDYGISHIMCLSSEDTGETAPFSAPDFADFFVPLPPPAPLNLEEMGKIAPLFDSVFKGGHALFEEFLKTNGDLYSVQRYLAVVSRILLAESDPHLLRRFADQLTEYAETLLLSRRFTYGLAFLATLTEIAAKTASQKNALHERTAGQVSRLTSCEWCDKMFDLAPKLPPEEHESFAAYLALVSPIHFEHVFLRTVELPSRELRLRCLDAITKDFGDPQMAKKLLAHTDWRVVRNTLYLMRSVKNELFVPLVRNVMNHPQRQVRIEAALVLSEYNADDNLSFWQKAVFSPEREIRLVAVKSVVRIKDIQAKSILDSLLRPQQIRNYPLDEIASFFSVIVSSGRQEFFDLVAAHLFSSDRELRMTTLKAMHGMSSADTIWRTLAKRVSSKDFLTLDREEIEQTIGLLREEGVRTVLPALEYLFTLQGGIFSRSQYRPVKEIVFAYIGKLRRVKFVQAWLEKAYAQGNKETRSVLEQFGIKGGS